MKKVLNVKNIKNIKNIRSILLTSLAVVLVLISVFTLIVIKSDYSFELKFNNEEFSFFNDETLYFNSAVDIDFAGKGYTTKLNGDKIKNNMTITEDGIYILEISKLIKHYSVTIKIDSNPDIYLIDNGGNIIHNYLSNCNPFKVVKTSDDISVYVNNIAYTNDTVIDEANNYLVTTDDNIYTVNIISLDN